mgnify:CR=1 FL=1
MKILTVDEKDLIIQDVDKLITALDRKIQNIYSEAYFERSQKAERYEALPWYKKLFVFRPDRVNEVSFLHIQVFPLEECISELIIVKSKLPSTAIRCINMTNEHYAQYQKAIQESKKLLTC